MNQILNIVMIAIRRLADNLSRRERRALQVAFDFFALAGCVWLAFQLRLGLGYGLGIQQIAVVVLAPVIGIPIFVRFGLYRAVLRYIPDMALWTIVKAVSLTTLAWSAGVFLLGYYGGEGVPRSVPLIFGVLAFSVTLVSRFAAKHVIHWKTDGAKTRYAVYGAGSAGLQYMSALAASGDAEVVALLDDDKRLQGREHHGVRVHDPNMVEELVRNLGIKNVVICMPSVSGQRRLEIAASLSRLKVNVQTLPSLSALIGGKYRVEPFDDLDLTELLGRSPVPPDFDLMRKAVAGKVVLVTGAGGSIGSELVETLAQNGASTIIMLDHSEFALFEVNRKMRGLGHASVLVPILGSVLDKQLLERVFRDYAPKMVFHAAAYKHVGLAEQNPVAAFKNNVLGTKALLEASSASVVDSFVLISTDKAVNPTSIMGATKRFAELLVRRYATDGASSKRYLSVRFGNVIGSKGSVIPIFKEQIRKGGPVVVRGDGTNRYFMAVSEACELIVQAAGMAEGGETFLLKMGEPVSILGLARSMIELSGLQVRDEDNPDGDIEIELVSMEPGEKMSEELTYDSASLRETGHPKIVKAKIMTNAHFFVDVHIDQLSAQLSTLSAGEASDAFMSALRECQTNKVDVDAGSEELNVIELSTRRMKG